MKPSQVKMARSKPSTKRATMVRDRVGCVKTSTRDLPGNEHAHGLEVKRDQEGAGQVISRWQTPVLSKPKTQSISIVEQNKRAAMSGARNASDFRKYQKNHVI